MLRPLVSKSFCIARTVSPTASTSTHQDLPCRDWMRGQKRAPLMMRCVKMGGILQSYSINAASDVHMPFLAVLLRHLAISLGVASYKDALCI
jgi:hypothetical protein